MEICRLLFQNIVHLSSKDKDYVAQKSYLKPFFKYAPTVDGLIEAAKNRKFDDEKRRLLVDEINHQYDAYQITSKQKENLKALSSKNTFSIITAHQPSLFTGPFYYIYKIISTISAVEKLNKNQTEFQFVPIFVSGGEDHDFEEINHMHLFSKRVVWETESGGAVGELSCESLQETLSQLFEILGESQNAENLKSILKNNFKPSYSYGKAMLGFTNDLFKEYGLLVLNMSTPKLKQGFIPIIEKEIFEQVSQPIIEKTQEELSNKGFSKQAHAREINFFYLQKGARNRIIKTENGFSIDGTDIRFSEGEMKKEINNHPERFSPNVVMRPIYQEYTVPNICYIGGGGEIAYWLERKKQFEAFGVDYPVLMRRNSVAWIDAKSLKKITKWDSSIEEWFANDAEGLIKLYLEKHQTADSNFDNHYKVIENALSEIQKEAKQVESTLDGKIGAQNTKILKQVEMLDSWVKRSEKAKSSQTLEQIQRLKTKLFPKGLQERYENFMPYYLKYGESLFTILLQNLDPFEEGFVVIFED